MKAGKEYLGKELAGARMPSQVELQLGASFLSTFEHLSSQTLPAGSNKNKQLSAKPFLSIFNFFILGTQSRAGGNTFKNNKKMT